MKVVLISLIEDVTVPSLRYLSAYLRAKGINTISILLPWQFTDKTLNEQNAHLYPYPGHVLKKILEICTSADLIGISMMSNHFDNAVYITRFLRKHLPHIPIIWGGIHPTIRPSECLEYTDMACVGEGEISLYQLCKGISEGNAWNSLSIPGIYKRNDKAPFFAGPIVNDINELPLPLYDLESFFMLYRGDIVPADGVLLQKCLDYKYRTLFSRGCPYACTYCCNNIIRKLNGGKHRAIRWRSLANMINELEETIRCMPHLKKIILADDSFLTRPIELIENFAKQYKVKIGLPFEILSIPRSISSNKLELLFDAGLCSIGIGIQSGSQRIRKSLYHRPESEQDILFASECIKNEIKKSKKQILVRYDFILDNPWEEEQDVLASIRLAMKLRNFDYSGWKFVLALFSLKFYPGTELYEKARSEGLVSDDLNQVYRTSQLIKGNTYLNEVFGVLAAGAPDLLINFFLWKPIRRLNLMVFLHMFGSIFRISKALKSIIKQEKCFPKVLLLRAFLKLTVLSRVKLKRPTFYGEAGKILVKKGKSFGMNIILWI